MTIRDSIIAAGPCAEGRAWLAMRSIYITAPEMYEAIPRPDWLAWSAYRMAAELGESALDDRFAERLHDVLVDLTLNTRAAVEEMVRFEVKWWHRVGADLADYRPREADYIAKTLRAIEEGLGEEDHPAFPYRDPAPETPVSFGYFAEACDDALPLPSSDEPARLLGVLADFLNRPDISGAVGGWPEWRAPVMNITRRALPKLAWCDLADLFVEFEEWGAES